MNVSTDLLVRLQAQQARIRNMCIMAHVDHGKTTLSDHLIGSNGLIHPRLMGELRYLDSREDEQARGITMKSSSISLLYVPGASHRPEGPRSVSDQEKLSSGYLINLIDSPGHVDFCSEVSTAARLSDGALVVVDAVEGVCIQTHAVLRQAWEEKVTPTLFINKIDRLIMELRLTPAEAYQRFQSIITHVNMIISAFHSEKYMSEADAVLGVETERGEAANASADRQHSTEESEHNGAAEEQDEEDAFQPVKCNVAFGSAYDGWAFRLDQFSEMYAEKLGCKPAALQRALWGDYGFSAKDKRVVRLKPGAAESGKAKPMFVQFILEPLWKAYGVLDGEDIQTVLGAIVKGRGLGQVLPAKALEHPEPRQALRSVLRAWLPLSEAVLGMAVSQLPSPAAAAPVRLPRLLAGTPGVPPPGLVASMASGDVQQLLAAERALAASDASPQAPMVVYVSKMVAVPFSVLPRRPGEPAPADPQAEVFLAFGRVFSGMVHEGQQVHVLSAAYSPAAPNSTHRQTATVTGVYMMMGRALERVQSVPAGCVLALAGLDSCVLKSATLSSSPAVRPLAPMLFQAAPIVRVAVEPALPSQLPQLVEGLRLLNRADPFVEISVLDSGEHVLGAAGEVHLETCVKDLRERFAKIQLQVSPPLVAFRETVCCQEEATAAAAANVTSTPHVCRPAKVVEAVTPNGLLVVRVRAHALPGTVTCALEEHMELIKRLTTHQPNQHEPQGAGQTNVLVSHGNEAAGVVPSNGAVIATTSVDVGSVGTEETATTGASNGHATAAALEASTDPQLESFRGQLRSVLATSGTKYQNQLTRAWQLGPKGLGPNILLAPPTVGSKAEGTGKHTSPGLFEVPVASVVKLAKQQQQQLGSQPQQHSNGDAEELQQAPVAAARKLATLPQIGRPAIAAALGFQVPPKSTASNPALDKAARNHNASSQSLDQKAAAADAESAAGASALCDLSQAPLDQSSRLAHIVACAESGLTAGFQMATSAGPLCEEPMWGVLFEVDLRLHLPEGHDQAHASDGHTSPSVTDLVEQMDLQEDVYGPFSGQVMTAVAGACRKAVMEAEPRLAEAHYLCAVQASAEALSGVYAVLGKRRARILREEMREGSDTFLVHAYLPVEASFGLADDMRRRSSGAAAASLLLSHWERLQVDPFFVPSTEEEREEHGEEGVSSNAANVARKLIDAVRRRKGLPVEEKVVKSATKQRTLKRNV